MPRQTAQESIDQILRSTIAETMKIASSALAQAVSNMAVQQLGRELESVMGGRTPRLVLSRSRRRRVRGEMTRWVVDNQARRVPLFVIDQTGLKTKKEIVARFGAGVIFEKGKPLPAKAK